jgi:L-2-hydroxyglutarate oxidase
LGYDVIISGAGIVGLATALKITENKPDIKLAVFEKESDVGLHQTSHNSGVIHSGIYYKPGSLKAENCIRGYKLLLEFCKRHGIEFEICGKVIVATDKSELPVLEDLYKRGIKNGLNEIRYLDGEELKNHEPYCSGIKAIYVPYTGIVDFRVVALKFCELIRQFADVKLNEKVIKLNMKSDGVEVVTGKQTYSSKLFINCSGLHSDEVARLSGMDPEIKIIPFRGEYYKLREDKKYLVKNLIYPVPDPEFPFLGVHFTRTIHGDVEAGPNAVLAFSKEGYSKKSINLSDTFSILRWKGFYAISSKYFKTGMAELYRSLFKNAFVKSLRKLVPAVKPDDLVYSGAGVRAQAVTRDGRLIDDFLIKSNNRVINVLNAPSPAATSSLAIGEKITDIALKFLN